MSKSKRASEEALDELHATVAEFLASALRSGEAPAAVAAVAVKFLKDNDITALPSSDRMKDVADSLNLPVFDDDDEGYAATLQ